METDQELLARYTRCKAELDKASKARERLKMGPARTHKAKWCGILLFTLLGIEQEMEERGLTRP
jgi:hypothetical protein